MTTKITPRRRALEKLMSLRHIVIRHHLPEWLTVLLCAAGLALAADMIRDPHSYIGTPSFRVALGPGGWAQPAVWGVLLGLPCAATLLALAARRRDLYWPLLGVCAWFCSWSLAILEGASDPDAVLSALIAYTLIASLAALLALVYVSDGRRT